MSIPNSSGAPVRGHQIVAFRRGTVEDAGSVSAFACRLFEETFASMNDPHDMAIYTAKAFTPAVQGIELAHPARVCVIGEQDGAIASYSLLRIGSLNSAVQGESCVEIERFYVDGSLHGRGVAQSMMDEVVSIARATGADALWLGVWSENGRAIRFYERSGFTDVGSQTFLLGTDLQIDRVMMRSLKT